jgi:hypothetical protein
MLSGATTNALAMAGTAVFKIVVSNDSMKKATATSQGNKRFTDVLGSAGGIATTLEFDEIILAADSIAGLQDLANNTSV